jgi:hypothetical protein
MRRVLSAFTTVLLLAGCDDNEPLTKLEKQNQELQMQLKSRDLDLQARRSADAQRKFDADWMTRDPTTIFLTHTSHWDMYKSGNDVPADSGQAIEVCHSGAERGQFRLYLRMARL